MPDTSNKKPLLSICVATYNQPEKFQRLMKSILPQLSAETELIIRDDSSNDLTQDFFKSLKISCAFHYFRGEKKGLDDAVLYLTETAHGSFVWWMGDDVIAQGGIKKVLSLIKNNPEMTFLWINSSDITNPQFLSVSDRGEYFFKDRNEVMGMDIGLLGFVTATVLRREIALSGVADAKKQPRFGFVCMYLTLHVLASPGRYYYLGEPYILCDAKPSGEVRWYDQFQAFGIVLFRTVMEFEGKFDKCVVKKTLAKNLRQCIKAVLVERGMGLKTGFASPLPKVLPMLSCYWSYWEAWVAMPFMLLPRPVLMVLYWVFKKLKKILSNTKDGV